MPGAMYEANDHFERAVFQRLDDDHMPGNLQQELHLLAENCECLDGGACRSGNHARYRALMHELTTEDEPKSLFVDASSCADLLVAVAHAVNGTKDSVRLGLDAMCTVGGVIGQVLEEHLHNILGMIRTIAEVPRTTSTTMSSRSHPKLRQIMPAVAVHGPWYQFLAMRICTPCTKMQLDPWWIWARRRGADNRWRLGKLETTYEGELPCGAAHMVAITLLARTGSLADGITGDHCSHVVMASKSALNGDTLGRYINTVLIQAAAQLGGETGNHAGGWGAARVLATVTLLWDELWAALAVEGESSVPMANCAAYALASDYAENVHCTVEEDGEMRFIMYEDPTVLHDVTIRMEFFQEGGQPQWSMAIINMWRDYTMRHWQVDKDMCFDRYVRAYLKDDSGSNMSKSTCNLAGVGWEDVRNWNNKNKGARAGTAQILTKRQM
ncbi:hypothetical protein EC957_009926 [Mortierella hygrophila]|uniref:Uncharacterized protein n=1 Tax=Mortierella hygrophila TaxID=979708 RepID=A0A9P6EWL4_9FUNG|nr:hypothetical protein EC957_009926 [Mortierella hygrophila]